MENSEMHMGDEHEHENFERGLGTVQNAAHEEQTRKSVQLSDDEQAVYGHEENYKANYLAGNGDSQDWQPRHTSREHERRRTSLEDLQRWGFSRTWPRLDRFEADARALPPSSASSINEPIGPQVERVDAIKSLDQLLLRPNEIALPEDTCVQQRTSSQPEITRPAREPERPLDKDFGPSQRSHSPLRRKRTDQWRKAQENRRPPRKLWDLVFASLQPGGRLRQERKLPLALIRKKHPVNSEPEFSEAEVYRSNVTKLAAQFSHLHNVSTDQTKTRHGWSSRIMFYDVLDPLQHEAIRLQEPWSGAKVQPDYQEFRNVLKKVSSDCIQRVILVEDISPSLIDYLGAAFDIPPHVFEEHLDGSGYASDLSQRSGAARWQNHFPDQGSSSVTWFRPVIPLLPITPELRDDLLQNRRPPIRCVASNCKEQHHIRVQTTTNIWRRNMALCPYPGVYNKHSETDYPVGWEERMTTCVREFGDCKYSILLLDPLPFARADSRVHARRQKAMQQKLTVVKASDPFSASQASRNRRGSMAADHINIENWVAEQQFSMSPDLQPESPVLSSPLEPPQDVEAELPRSPPSPPNSTLSVLPEPPKPRPSGVRFLDPKRPAKTRVDGTGTKAGLAGVGSSSVEPRSQPTRLGVKRASGGGQHLDGRSSNPSHRKSFAEAHPSLSRDPGSSGPPTIRGNTHDRFLLYHPIKAAPSSSAKLGVAITALDIPAYIERLQVPGSTLEKFEASMRNLGKGKETAFDPLRAVFRIIHDDTNSLMDVIEDSLQRIRSDTLDEALLEQRITFWRKLIHNLNSGLTELDQQLRAFVHFMNDLESLYFSGSQRDELPSERIARDTRQTLRTCLGQLERSSMALLTEIQIVDSRRSIAEAESISKLTELAFVFIPLSFVASLFSMEIRELDGGVPVYIFILAAFATVFIAYSMRLGIRSSRLIEFKDKMKLQVRAKAHVPHNRPIPTHVFLRWVCSITARSFIDSTTRVLAIVSPILLTATLIAAILAPLIALWLRNIDKGFTAVITLLILPLDAVFVVPLIKSCYKSLGSDPINTLRDLRQRYQESQKKRTMTRRGKGSADPEDQAPTLSGSYYLGEFPDMDRVREVSDDTSTTHQVQSPRVFGMRSGRRKANEDALSASSSHVELKG